MKYRDGFKYQLAENETFDVLFFPDVGIKTKFVTLTSNGRLTLRRGFAWDGTSGGVIDRKTNMRASACHDALYRLMRMGLLDHKEWRRADHEFARVLKLDGAWSITIKIDMAGLAVAKGSAANPINKVKVKTAP